MTSEEKMFSPAMKSALRAVARIKGDSRIAWDMLLTEADHDDRVTPVAEPDPQQGWKPAGR